MQAIFIQQKIFEIREQKVMAALYEVETRVLNQAVKRNIDRFPEDFMFRIAKKEWTGMRSQFVIASEQIDRNQVSMRSQIVTSYTQPNDNQATNSSQFVKLEIK